jgi:4'-phosphopantetheinyl transferase
VVIGIAAIEIGIDIEWIDAKTETFAIADRFFAPGEVEAIRRVPPDQQHTAFFDCWTRKEALLKATGFGLGIPLDSFAVSIPHEAPRIVGAYDERLRPELWSLANLQVPPGFAGAVAISGRLDTVVDFHWQV